MLTTKNFICYKSQQSAESREGNPITLIALSLIQFAEMKDPIDPTHHIIEINLSKGENTQMRRSVTNAREERANVMMFSADS